MTNATMEKFGFPDTVIENGGSWVVQLRPVQVTLGSMVLICKEPVESFAQVSERGFAELKKFTARIENALKRAFRFDKINYLMLMMVDRDVHFHVIPRYENEQVFAGIRFRDFGWPGPPDLTRGNETGRSINQELCRYLAGLFD